MVVQTQLYTIDQFWDEFGSSKRVELVRGVPVEMAPTGTAHMIVVAWLAHLMYTFVEQHSLGVVTASEGGFTLAHNPDTVRAPDVGFIRQERLVAPTPERYFPGPPDLAVEVVSPHDRASDIHDKVMDFLHAGTQLVWVVYPASRTVAIYQPDASARILHADDTLDGEEVLPGFALPVRDAFKKLQD
ncbi:MAG: Uma2 family endonuclease [Chloroflexi bacterium]|nr:Uma2 family endonuclease [Chloroflexota bacterium]